MKIRSEHDFDEQDLRVFWCWRKIVVAEQKRNTSKNDKRRVIILEKKHWFTETTWSGCEFKLKGQCLFDDIGILTQMKDFKFWPIEAEVYFFMVDMYCANKYIWIALLEVGHFRAAIFYNTRIAPA